VFFDGSKIFIEGLLRRENGVMDRWKRGESLKAIDELWVSVIVDLFFGGSAWWDSSAQRRRQAGIDAGERG